MASGLPMTRRAALRAGAGAGMALAAGAGRLPAWARPVADLARVRRPGSRPVPRKPEGEHLIPEIRHVVVVMLENHSFDNMLGMLPHRVRSRRGVDGLPTTRSGRQLAVNRDALGHPVRASHDATVCPPGGISQSWKASHISWNHGRNDGFVRASSSEAMSFFDQHDIPFTYALASEFPVGERYFGSTLCQTYPNRRFLFTGTASGLTATSGATFSTPAANGTIFDRLDRLGITWKTYYTTLPSMALVPNASTPARQRRLVKIDRYYADAASGHLPSVSFVEPNFDVESQENPQDIQFGERFLERVVRALMHSPAWAHSALFITYDEHGGYYDHVPPPRAIKPDSTPPRLKPDDPPGAFDRYGFRVPLIAVSPYARANYVSRVVQDHTSILRFIEGTWNIGAMTFRDANAADMTDYFDFRRPAFRHPPHLAAAPPISPGLAKCRAHGQNPPVVAVGAGSAAGAAGLRAGLPRS